MSFGRLIEALEQAEAAGRTVAPPGVDGLAGERTAGLLQRLALGAAVPGACYLELGVFQGYTLCSVAAAAPAMACFGIDNFAQFDPQGANRGLVEARLRAHTTGNASLINLDFEEALLSLPRHIGERQVAVYFVDGPHDYRSQFLSLDLARPHLAPEAVVVVDDCNYEHVRRANADWLRCNPEFALLYDAYSAAHPDHLRGAALAAARAGWWNGVNVLVRDPGRSLERSYPPVDASRERYFNDHWVHPARYAELAPALLRILGRLPAGGRFSGRYPGTNTYSEALPSRRIARFRQKAE
jgi:hypothetical protein